MAKQISSANPSLLLHEVLEAEFIGLHGELPADYPTSTDPATRLKAIWGAVHGLEEKRAALCISGGGIRSATFGLGVLQGLARCNLLNKFHYLSTIAGGAHIGAWFTAWVHRAGGGLTEVATCLARPLSHTGLSAEAPEIQNLRSYSNYLSPHFGFFSSDMWRLLAAYIRNLAAMSMVLIPLLAAALTIPWLYVSILMVNPPPYTDALFWAGALLMDVAVAYIGFNLPCGRDLGWNQKRFLLFCVLPLFFASALMTMHWAWFKYYGRSLIGWPLFGFGEPHTWVPFLYLGIALNLVSWLSSLLPAHGFRFSEFLAITISGAMGGALLWFCTERLSPQPIASAELYSCFGIATLLAIFFLAIQGFGLISSRWTADSDREWWGRAAGLILSALIVWIGISVLMIFGPHLLTRVLGWGTSTLTVGGIAGLFTLLAGRFGFIPAKVKQDDKFGPVALLIFNTTSLAALVFGIALIVLIFRGLTLIMFYVLNAGKVIVNFDAVSQLLRRPDQHLNVLLYTPWWAIVGIAVLFGFLAVGFAGVINVNKFSLQAMYRDRLIPAYLGAANNHRRPNLFTGFDEGDNLQMQELKTSRLFPVINATANLVGGAKLGWQEARKTSFTVSPLHCGSREIGYRTTYGLDGEQYGRRLSLGTAIAVSGAAANPNVGYYASPLVRLVLTLFNARLGAWWGNPGRAGDHTFHLAYPKLSVGPIIAETFGLNDDTYPYVSVSDGRHFEHLGLYEMVLRRCHYVVVCDGGRDGDCTLEYLGNAVRKIRIELGIPIEFGPITIYPRSKKNTLKAPGHNCAIGRIRYSVMDGSTVSDGILIYIKPAWYGDGPADVIEYSRRNEAFPHEVSRDRFFSEAQFESYRMLGAYTMEKLCQDCGGDFPSFIREILTNHLQIQPPDWLATLIQMPPTDSDTTRPA